MRRIAASCIITPDGKEYHNHVVELDGDHIVSLYPLTSELPMTEWYGDTLELTLPSSS